MLRWLFDCRVSPLPSHVALVLVHTSHLSIQGDGSGGAVEQFSPRLSSTFLLHPPLHFPRPGEDRYLSRISKCAWMQDGILEKRYEGTERKKRETVCTLPPPYADTQTCTLFFAWSTKSLLQKGESGQKTGSLITLSSNLILIFRRCKREP